jgi:hypothetical protein
MKGFISAVLLAGLGAVSTAGEDVVFHKSKILYVNSTKDRKVDLLFMSERKAMVVREGKSVLTVIPFDAINEVQYGNSQRHRWREAGGCLGGDPLGAAIVCPFWVPIVASTTEKSHWLDVYYKTAGIDELFSLKVDKAESQAILATAKAQIGTDVEILPKAGKDNRKDKAPLAAPALMPPASEGVVFHKSRTVEPYALASDYENKVDLQFLADKKAIVVRAKASVLTVIPYDAIDHLEYEYANHTRDGVGHPLFLATKNHWLVVHYKSANIPLMSSIKMDASEYPAIIETIKEQTGKDVETLSGEVNGK